jgi:hypothetical protein
MDRHLLKSSFAEGFGFFPVPWGPLLLLRRWPVSDQGHERIHDEARMRRSVLAGRFPPPTRRRGKEFQAFASSLSVMASG